jgi:hypothetical protein
VVFKNPAKVSVVFGRHKKEALNNVLRCFGFYLYKLQQDIERKITQKGLSAQKGIIKCKKLRGLSRVYRFCKKILKVYSKTARPLAESNFFKFGSIPDKVHLDLILKEY